MTPHKYSKEELQFIKENVAGLSNVELTNRFNQQFKLNHDVDQVKACKKNHGWSSGLTGQFEKGHIPVNPIQKGDHISPGTEFKKGQRPINYMPVGSERVNGDGYVDVKITDPNKWKAKHVLLWEAANGPVPKGCSLLFADQDRMHISLDNLILITNAERAILNRNHLIKKDSEYTKSGVLVAKLMQKVSQRAKEGK